MLQERITGNRATYNVGELLLVLQWVQFNEAVKVALATMIGIPEYHNSEVKKINYVIIMR